MEVYHQPPSDYKKQHNKDYYLLNQEKIKEKHKQWKINNPQKTKVYKKKYYEKKKQENMNFLNEILNNCGLCAGIKDIKNKQK